MPSPTASVPPSPATAMADEYRALTLRARTVGIEEQEEDRRLEQRKALIAELAEGRPRVVEAARGAPPGLSVTLQYRSAVEFARAFAVTVGEVALQLYTLHPYPVRTSVHVRFRRGVLAQLTGEVVGIDDGVMGLRLPGLSPDDADELLETIAWAAAERILQPLAPPERLEPVAKKRDEGSPSRAPKGAEQRVSSPRPPALPSRRAGGTRPPPLDRYLRALKGPPPLPSAARTPGPPLQQLARTPGPQAPPLPSAARLPGPPAPPLPSSARTPGPQAPPLQQLARTPGPQAPPLQQLARTPGPQAPPLQQLARTPGPPAPPLPSAARTPGPPAPPLPSAARTPGPQAPPLPSAARTPGSQAPRLPSAARTPGPQAPPVLQPAPTSAPSVPSPATEREDGAAKQPEGTGGVEDA